MLIQPYNCSSPAPSHIRAALAAGLCAVALAGCGGSGSDDAPPASQLAAPANFTAHDIGTLGWTAAPGATRYELYVDPDGTGPLPETRAEDYSQASGTGFSYQPAGSDGFAGTYRAAPTAPSPVAGLNASYRLRACDASDCGAFTAVKTYDIANALGHEFASGRVPLQSASGVAGLPRLSRDGLTLAIRSPSAGTDSAVNVFTRGNGTQPWQLQAQIRSGKGYFAQGIALSSDGNSLAVLALEALGNDATSLRGVAYVYQRSSGTWNQRAYLTPPDAPASCAQPCRADISNQLALSGDGNILAAAVSFSSTTDGSTSSGAVAAYQRAGATWARQAVLQAGGKAPTALALSDDGSTLAVNENALDTRQPQLTATTPHVLVFARPGNNDAWSQQARIPAGIVSTLDIAAILYSTLALSSDGSTLAVHSLNIPGHQNPALDIKAADLSCGTAVTDSWYIGLHARSGSAWQRQTAISRGLAGRWALAGDGRGLYYGGSLFARNGSNWTCP